MENMILVTVLKNDKKDLLSHRDANFLRGERQLHVM